MTSLAGNTAAKAAFRAALSGTQLHHAWLFAGPEGVGKASFARQAAMRMLAEAAGKGELYGDFDVPEDHSARRMIEAGAHPDYREMARLPKDAGKPGQDLARSIPIAQVRALGPMFATKPSMSARRVVVIDCDRRCRTPRRRQRTAQESRRAAPGDDLPARQPFAGPAAPHHPFALPTVAVRPVERRRGGIGPARTELPEASATEIEALVRAAAGSPGRALGFAGLDLATLDTEMSAIAARGDPDNSIRAASRQDCWRQRRRSRATKRSSPAFLPSSRPRREESRAGHSRMRSMPMNRRRNSAHSRSRNRLMRRQRCSKWAASSRDWRRASCPARMCTFTASVRPQPVEGPFLRGQRER